jgi:hypothetical protein
MVGFQGGDTALFASADGSIEISGISHLKEYSVNKLTGDVSAGGTGNPAHILLNSMGIAISAHSVDGSAKPTEAKTYYIAESHTSGDTKIVMDSSVAKAFQLKAAKAPAAKTPGSPTAYHVELDTDRTDYAGSEAAGKLTIPSAFEFHGHAESSKDDNDIKRPVHIRSTQEFNMHGMSGELNIDPRPGMGVQAIKDGVFEGPVTFSGQRVAKDLEKKTQTISKLLNGRCDRVRIVTDGNGETIVLEGHVSFDLQDETGTMHVPNADTFRFLFDRDLNPVSIDGSQLVMSVSVKS